MWCVWYQKLPFNILIPHFREPLFDCLKDVDLIPPFNRMLLEVTFGKLYSWAVHNIRDILLEASARFKELGELLVHMFLSAWYQQKCHTHLLTCCPTVFEPGVQPVPLQTITNENPAGPSLGTIPQARFLLSMIHMLSLKHGSNSLSLLLNSGILALTQSILRLIGEYCPLYLENYIWKHLSKQVFLSFFSFPGPSTDSTEEDLSLCGLGGSATVLEESRKEATPAPLPASGPELAAMMKIGTRVMRGVDWKWGDQVPKWFYIP